MSTQPSTTEVTTEYGIRQPNGNEAWGVKVATLPPGGFSKERDIREVHELGHVRQSFVRHLADTADKAGIDIVKFIRGHRLITRQRIVITLAPEDADPTVQLSAGEYEEVPF